MSILSEQLVISDKVISNVITTDPEARSLTMRNGYYVDHKYPDNRSEMTGENPWTGTTTQTIRTYDFSIMEEVTTEVTTTDQIAISETAGQIG